MTLIDPDLFHALRGACSPEQALVFDDILFQHTVTEFMERTETALDQLRQGLQTMAATLQDILTLMTSMNTVLTDIGADYDQQATVIAQQDAIIVQLRAQIAAGTPITQADLDALVDTMTAQRDRAKAMADRVAAVVTPPPA